MATKDMRGGAWYIDNVFDDTWHHVCRQVEAGDDYILESTADKAFAQWLVKRLNDDGQVPTYEDLHPEAEGASDGEG